jgi:hypothetical protein
MIEDDRATVRIIDPALIRRARGDFGRAPAPFLAQMLPIAMRCARPQPKACERI